MLRRIEMRFDSLKEANHFVNAWNSRRPDHEAYGGSQSAIISIWKDTDVHAICEDLQEVLPKSAGY